MQNLMSKWLPLIGAIVSAIFFGNGGYVISDGLNSNGANIGTIAQGIASLFGGLIFGGAGWYFKGGKADTTTFDDDSQAVKHLATTCKGCPESQKALDIIHSRILQRLYQDDA